MNHSIENISATRAKVTVTISGDEIAAQDRAALRDVSKHASIPGFRPGKSPEGMLRKRFAKQIAEETARKCHTAAYEYARDKSGLKIYTLVDVHEVELAPGSDASPSFSFDLNPEFELPSYEGITTMVFPVHVDDADVDAEVENLRRSRAYYSPVERAAAIGDYVKVSYVGSIEGQPIEELTDKTIWSAQENTWEEAAVAGSDTIGVPAVVEGIIGLAAGQEKDVEQDFEENHEVETLRGKKGVYHISVHEVRERVLPELDEEFLKSIKMDSVEQLRERIHEELESRKSNDRRMSQREQIAHILLDSADFEVPQSAVETETRNVLERIMRENMQRGVPQDEFESHKEELHAKASEIAVIQTRRNFMLAAIARAEKVEVTNEDLNQTIMAQSMRMRVRPEELVKELGKDRESLRIMQRDILLDKTMDLLVDKASVVESEEAPAHDHEH